MKFKLILTMDSGKELVKEGTYEGTREEFYEELPDLFKSFSIIKCNNGIAFTNKIESVEVVIE